MRCSSRNPLGGPSGRSAALGTALADHLGRRTLRCLIPPPAVAGESDGDGDVDLFDFAAFLHCVTGPGGRAPPDCATFDLDGGNDIDLRDFGVLQLAFMGGAA